VSQNVYFSMKDRYKEIILFLSF